MKVALSTIKQTSKHDISFMLLASIIFLPKINLSNQAKILYLKDVRYIWLSNFMALKVPYEGYSNLITVLSIHVLGNLKKTFFMTDVRFAHPTSTSPMGENMTLRNI